jgi:hypothetical protein
MSVVSPVVSASCASTTLLQPLSLNAQSGLRMLLQHIGSPLEPCHLTLQPLQPPSVLDVEKTADMQRQNWGGSGAYPALGLDPPAQDSGSLRGVQPLQGNDSLRPYMARVPNTCQPETDTRGQRQSGDSRRQDTGRAQGALDPSLIQRLQHSRFGSPPCLAKLRHILR